MAISNLRASRARLARSEIRSRAQSAKALRRPERRVYRLASLGLTRIRRENSAFNHGFFRPNPLSFPGVDQKNADHGRNFTRSSEPEQASLNLAGV